MDCSDLLNFQQLDNEIQNIIDHSEFQNHLKIQLEEIDVLRAMYYKEKEFIIDDMLFSKVSNFVSGEISEVPPTLDFTIHVIVDKLNIEIQVVLPRLYPTTEPRMFIRSNQLTPSQQISLNSDLKLFLSSLERGRICVLEGILWISNIVSEYSVDEEKIKVKTNRTNVNKLFSRYWIYSHHIYSKEKRKHILTLAKQYNVTGFCLGGKPGIICGEGWHDDCNEWWQNIRNMTWKKIICKKVEESKISVNECDSQRKFKGFLEINFQNLKSTKSETHTDMGEFYRYLVLHSCGHVFKDYFGFDGKVSAVN